MGQEKHDAGLRSFRDPGFPHPGPVEKRLRADGREPTHSTPEEFGRVVARDIAKWSQVLKLGNIKID